MCSVFVGNIAWDVSEQELGDWFSQCGRVMSAYIKVDQTTGGTLGYGFVEFTDPNIQDAVIKKMDGTLLAGRNLRCNRSNRPTAKIMNQPPPSGMETEAGAHQLRQSHSNSSSNSNSYAPRSGAGYRGQHSAGSVGTGYVPKRENSQPQGAAGQPMTGYGQVQRGTKMEYSPYG